MIHITNYKDLDKTLWGVSQQDWVPMVDAKIISMTTADMGLLEWAMIYTLKERPDLHPDIADGLDLLLAQMNKINQHKPA
jgi:hypothetical protein